MRLRRFNIGCFGGGHGVAQPHRRAQAEPLAARQCGGHHVRQRRQLRAAARNQLGVLPPGDVLAVRAGLGPQRDRGEADPADPPVRLRARPARAAITGGNLLLSMMEQYTRRLSRPRSRGLRTLLDCVGLVWPISVEQAAVCAEYEGRFDHPAGEVERSTPAQRQGSPRPPHPARPPGRHPSRRGGPPFRASTRVVIGPRQLPTRAWCRPSSPPGVRDAVAAGRRADSCWSPTSSPRDAAWKASPPRRRWPASAR